MKEDLHPSFTYSPGTCHRLHESSFSSSTNATQWALVYSWQNSVSHASQSVKPQCTNSHYFQQSAAIHPPHPSSSGLQPKLKLWKKEKEIEQGCQGCYIALRIGAGPNVLISMQGANNKTKSKFPMELVTLDHATQDWHKSPHIHQRLLMRVSNDLDCTLAFLSTSTIFPSNFNELSN